MTIPSKKYDIADRTLNFARSIRQLIKTLPRTLTNIEDGKQLTRSSGSVGANYLEACEALSKKDFLMRLKISRKEARESAYWLELIQVEATQNLIHQDLLSEARQLVKIFTAIIIKTEQRN
ncbi:MAG: four helix bundle protein [Candidatus Komeilibacteria bacterium]